MQRLLTQLQDIETQFHQNRIHQFDGDIQQLRRYINNNMRYFQASDTGERPTIPRRGNRDQTYEETLGFLQGDVDELQQFIDDGGIGVYNDLENLLDQIDDIAANYEDRLDEMYAEESIRYILDEEARNIQYYITNINQFVGNQFIDYRMYNNIDMLKNTIETISGLIDDIRNKLES